MLRLYEVQSLGDSVNVVFTLNTLGITLEKKDKVAMYNFFRKNSGYVLLTNNSVIFTSNDNLLHCVN